MTNAELLAKIKAEIERRMYKNPEVEYDHGFNDALEYLLYFLDTLESENPAPADLEEAAEESSAQYYKDAGYSPFPNMETAAHKSGFIAGAKWQKVQMMDEWLKDRDGCFWDGVEEGKKAMREQMMKEAVEGTLASTTVGYPAIFLDEMKSGLHLGDKVKLIICKEDEE